MSKSCIIYSIAGCPTNYQQNPLQTVKFYYDHDINVVPIQPGTKLPLGSWKDYQKQRQTWPELARMNWRGGLAGINGVSGILSFDFDHAPFFAPVDQLLTALGLPIDYPWASRSGYGYHIWIKCGEELILNGILKTRYVGLPKNPLEAGYEWDNQELPFKQLEIRIKDCYTILPPTRYPASDKRYEWMHSHSFPDQELAVVTAAQIAAAFYSIAILDSNPPSPTLHRQSPLPSIPAPLPASLPLLQSNYVAAALAGEVAKLASAPEGTRNSQLFHSTAALSELVAIGALDQSTMVETLTRAAQSTGLSDREIASTIRSGLNSGMQHPRQLPSLEVAGPGSIVSPPLDANIAAQLLLYDADDAGNARSVLFLYRDHILYTDALNWLHWNGTYWEQDVAAIKRTVISALRVRKSAARAAEVEAIRKVAKGDDSRIRGAMNVLKAYRTVKISEFDNEPDLLNTLDGVVNLRTGTIKPHSSEQRFTYCIPFSLGSIEAAQPWIEFLRAALDGEEMLDYLQMAVGYSITGHTVEEKLFYLYGPTRSGKGTFMETLLALLPRPLSDEIDFNTFTSKREGSDQNFDLAPLKPSRIIMASESNRYQAFNAAKIKQLTGGNRVRAAFKFQDMFSYKPQYKIWLASNHQVNGDADDDALWGRLHIINFSQSHLGREDLSLKQRLRSPEVLCGVLYWAIQGAMKWYEAGRLPHPEQMKQSLATHRLVLDTVQMWLDEKAELVEVAWTSNSDITSSYTAWCRENNVEPKNRQELSRVLKA